MSSDSLPIPSYPIPISYIAKRYYLYNIHHITHVRHTHNIPGVLIGTLPQAPQQNVFLGLPLELMAEEARLLVAKAVAFIVDDVASHKKTLKGLQKADRERWRSVLQEQGREVGRQAMKVAQSRTDAAIQKMPGDLREKALRRLESEGRFRRWDSCEILNATSKPPPTGSNSNDEEIEDTLFPAYSQASPSTSQASKHINSSTTSTQSTAPPSPPRSPNPVTDTSAITSFAITPTMSQPLLPPPAAPFSATSANHTHLLPQVPSSYPFYAHLHSLSYFLSPGLRFGCQYMVYPGDPLRFHSHFLAVGYEWDEEFELLTLVGGGRLGTGVKKGFLIGGRVEKGDAVLDKDKDLNTLGKGVVEGNGEVAGAGEGEVRCFCIEWGGM